MAGVLRIENIPTTIAGVDRQKLSGGASPGCDCTVVLRAAAEYEIGIAGMDHDRVAIRNLPFAFEMIALNSFPAVTAIRAAEHTQQHVVIAAGFILRKRIEHIRSGRTNGQCGAPEV